MVLVTGLSMVNVQDDGMRVLWVYRCHKPPIFLGMVNIPTIYGDDWGMAYRCCTHITNRYPLMVPTVVVNSS